MIILFVFKIYEGATHAFFIYSGDPEIKKKNSSLPLSNQTNNQYQFNLQQQQQQQQQFNYQQQQQYNNPYNYQAQAQSHFNSMISESGYDQHENTMYEVVNTQNNNPFYRQQQQQQNQQITINSQQQQQEYNDNHFNNNNNNHFKLIHHLHKHSSKQINRFQYRVNVKYTFQANTMPSTFICHVY
jgi:hypothetical protein